MSKVINSENLRDAIFRRGMTQQALADKSGVAPSVVSAALHGRPIAATTFRKLCLVLAETPAVYDDVDALILGAGAAREVPGQ